MVTMPGQNGGTRIPIPPIGINAAGGDEVPQRKEINRFVSRGPVRAGQPPVATVKETRLDQQGNLVEITTVYSAACRACGRQMKVEDDVGGMCPICGYVVCSACIEKFEADDSQRRGCPACLRGDESDASGWSSLEE